MVQTGLNGFWRLIIAPQVPPLEIWVNSLYPKCPVLSACVTFCHPFVPVLPGEKQPPAATLTVCINTEYQLPSFSISKQEKERENVLPFPKETLSVQSHG